MQIAAGLRIFKAEAIEEILVFNTRINLTNIIGFKGIKFSMYIEGSLRKYDSPYIDIKITHSLLNSYYQ